MENIFGSQNTSQDSGDHWLTVSDLMAGLMVVFLFIAIVFYDDNSKENDKIKDVAVAYQQNQVAIYEALESEFEKTLISGEQQ